MICKNCGSDEGENLTLVCPNCGADICEKCSLESDRICPYCYSTLEYRT